MASGIQSLSTRVSSAIQKSNWNIPTILGLKKQNDEKRTYFTYSRELCHVVNNEPKWVSPEEAVKCINSGNTVFMSGAAATPIDLAEAMSKHGKANNLKDITVCHMHTEGPATYAKPGYEGNDVVENLSGLMIILCRKTCHG